MVQALRTHRVNTLAELRRIERCLAASATTEVSEAMTKACKCQFSDFVPENLADQNHRGILCKLQHVVDGAPKLDQKLSFQVGCSVYLLVPLSLANKSVLPALTMRKVAYTAILLATEVGTFVGLC
jgi:hypothetical protein